jgi:hypothetical protein
LGVGDLKVIDDLGWPILVFITLTSPFGIFAVASHSKTFSATPETEKGVSQLKRGSRTLNYHHPLLLATRAMGLNGMAGPLGLPLDGLYARRLSLLWPGFAHIP